MPDQEPLSFGSEVLVGGYDWLTMSCRVINTLCLMLITVTLIARL